MEKIHFVEKKSKKLGKKQFFGKKQKWEQNQFPKKNLKLGKSKFFEKNQKLDKNQFFEKKLKIVFWRKIKNVSIKIKIVCRKIIVFWIKVDFFCEKSKMLG